MSSSDGAKYREVSRSCMIVGTGLGAVIAFLFTVIIGAFHGFGIVLFLALTWVLGMALARICARRSDGDLLGLGKTFGLLKAEQEGRLSSDHLSRKLSEKMGEGRKNVAESDTGRAITETKESVKAAATEVKEDVTSTAKRLAEDTKAAVTGKGKGDPADVPTAGPPPAPGRGPSEPSQATTSLGSADEAAGRGAGERGAPSSSTAGASGGSATPPTGGAAGGSTPAPPTGGAAAGSTAPQPASAPPAPQSIPPEARTPADATQEDDLQKIAGVGPQAAARLKEMGVTRFAQIAAWSDEDIDRMERELGGAVAGRIRRDDWVGQARTYAAGS